MSTRYSRRVATSRARVGAFPRGEAGRQDDFVAELAHPVPAPVRPGASSRATPSMNVGHTPSPTTSLFGVG